MESRCACCDAETDQHKLIRCCICKQSYRYACAGLTANDVKIISTKPGLSFTCSNCTVIGKDLNELKAVIADLKNQVVDLKAQNVGQSTNRSLNCIEFNDIVQEVIERQNRVKNLIFYGTNETPDSDRIVSLSHDTSEVKNVLDFLECNANTVDIKPVRLGKYIQDSERPRPIKIIFESEVAVQNIIRKAKQLKDSDFEHISISRDRTRNQIEYYRKLKKELDVRKANGENNLVIRTLNGIPQIRSLNPVSPTD